ncbi:MAG: EAL domain-containing protein [Rhodobacteraceae bacterium]|nr:EAL domain-containing protein [Paracoccaceae bacterium]
MGRIATIFIAICMGTIAISAAAVLMFQFGRPFGEAVSLSLALMCTMAVFHLLISRARDRGALRDTVDRLEDRMADLDDDVGNLEGRLTGVEHSVPRQTRDEMDPLFSEVEVLGSLVKQMAEAMSDLEARFEDQQLLPVAPPRAELPHYSQQYQTPSNGYDPRQPYPPQPSYPQDRQSAQEPSAPRSYEEQARDERSRYEASQESTRQAPLEQPRTSADEEQPRGRGERTEEPKAPNRGRDTADAQPHAGEREDLPSQEPEIDMHAPASDPVMHEIILSALNANRVELHLQPIVTLPQRQVRYYEAFTRLRDSDGNLLEASEFLPEAVRSGLIARIDSLQLFRSVQVTKRLGSRNRSTILFCNLSSFSLVDETFFPGFLEFVNANRHFSEVLIFEFSQEDVAQMGAMELESLSALYELGFTFSIDRITTLRMDFKALAQKGFKYAKLKAGILLGDIKADHGHIHPTDFGDLLARFGMELIADHVEMESQVLELLDYDVQLAQGNLFSTPRPVRAEILQGTPAPAARKRA